MKFKFNNNKKLMILAISVTTAISMCSCEQVSSIISSKSAEIESSTSQIVQPSESVIVSPTTSSTETQESSKPEPTGFEDYIDETEPHAEPIGQNDYDAIKGWLHLCRNGMDNPILIKYLKQYFNNNDITIDDVDYLCHIGHTDSSNASGYDGGFSDLIASLKDSTFTIDINFIRYVMSRNNLRFWGDETNYSLMYNLFPEYVSILNNEDYDTLSKLENDKRLDDFHDSRENDYSIINFYEFNGENFDDFFYYYLYRDISEFNVVRYECILDDPSCVELGRNSQGYIVIVPTEIQYNKYNNGFNQVPGCENIDILKVETREDLINSLGLETVEFYDEVYDQILKLSDEYFKENGIDPSSETLGASRSRCGI